MFENLGFQGRACVWEQCKLELCSLILSKKPCYLKLGYLFFHSPELPLLWILMTWEISWASAVTSTGQLIKWCCVPFAVSCENIPSGNLGSIRIVRYLRFWAYHLDSPNLLWKRILWGWPLGYLRSVKGRRGSRQGGCYFFISHLLTYHMFNQQFSTFIISSF